MEDGKDEKFPSTHTSNRMDTQKPLDSPILQYSGRSVGFHCDLGGFGVIGVWERLACGCVVLDVPFNPTYGFSLES